VALTLEVLPLINAKGEVSMDIVQKIDEQNGTTRIDNNGHPED
jgi:type II secretory pathway component GspD/PulD (secretin)